STSNALSQAAIYKSDDGVNFTEAFDFGGDMRATFDFDILNLGGGFGLYALNYNLTGGGTTYLTKLNPNGTFTSSALGQTGWYARDIISFNSKAYAGFYDGANAYTLLKNSTDLASWQTVGYPSFGPTADPPYYPNIWYPSSSVFKGKLYMGTLNRTIAGRPATGAHIWRSTDGTTWEGVVLNGFGSAQRYIISYLSVFGGYIYATTNDNYGRNYIYRSQTGDSGTWSLAYTGPLNERNFGGLMPYMGRLYFTSAIYFNYVDPGGRVYSSADGETYTAVSAYDINNDSSGYLTGALHPYRGFIYANTSNTRTGTNLFRAKLAP
ncbi:MAG: hypothetical protein Q8R48_03270, partial [Candidatus Omnitrophota bacterium]|nr:hypothetical protein [Candidatus Omnitrophota bacterium]